LGHQAAELAKAGLLRTAGRRGLTISTSTTMSVIVGSPVMTIEMSSTIIK